MPGTVEANTPAGFVAIEGAFDRHTQRFDLSTLEVIEDLSLSAERDQSQRRQRALASIDELERRQARPLRELVIDSTNVDARRRVSEIEVQIVELRGTLT